MKTFLIDVMLKILKLKHCSKKESRELVPEKGKIPVSEFGKEYDVSTGLRTCE